MSAQIIELPDNLIGLEDRRRLESLGSHEIQLGRATRFRWEADQNGDPVFEIYRGGIYERLAVRISRKRENDAFYAEDPYGHLIAAGMLDHVMATLDRKLAEEHGEDLSAS